MAIVLKKTVMTYTKLNNIVGWIVFLIAAFTYVSTVEPSTSLWDCGEYISTSNKLEIGHPPGAPLFMMLGRIFSAFSSPENAAFMVNVLSGLSSAFAILFLFWTITHFAKKIVRIDEKTFTKGSIYAIIGSGVVGALSYTFTDTFWFSAVEGEVYGMSSFFTAVTFWAILKWEDNAESPSSDRWLILIFYLIGLSIGVHLLNLLVVPAACFVFYFKKYEFNIKGFLITGVISIVLLGFLNSVLIPSTVSIAGGFEKFFTNSLGTGFNVGTFFFFAFIFGLVVAALFYAHKKANRIIHTSAMSLIVFIIGFSSFAMIMIRSNANPPLDENDPETLPSLASYLAREQYGDWSLSYGGYWNTPRGGQYMKSDGKVKKKFFKAYVVNDRGVEKSFKTKFDAENYLKAKKMPLDAYEQKYIVSSESTGQEYKDEYNKYLTFLPRMYWPGNDKRRGYMFWSGYEGDKSKPIPGKSPQEPDYYLPTFGENMTFMFNYQLGWMYWRYFLWNFAGRQNDLQGYGYDMNDDMVYLGSLGRGNWVTGIDFIDSQRVGSTKNMPTTLKGDKGYNVYYYIPLILGLLGLVFHVIKHPKDTFTLFLLFFFTGMAILLYLNQRPEEPRERDYAVAASFYVFAVWIGLSVLALYHWGRTLKAEGFKKGLIGAGAAAALFTVADLVNGGGMAFGYSMIYICVVGVALVGIAMLLNRTQNAMLLVGFACIAGLSSPYLLATQNWDDHDRSGRYFARDIAHNYLGTCGKNAVLFCFGDNDTFPLWFAQEVEGYRTDMKVINYSLLSSDWHYSQMKRATYDAPPVETTLEEPDFRAGTRDLVFLGDNDRRISALQFVSFMKAGNDIKNPQLAASGVGSIPYNKLYIQVDKDAAIKSGIVKESERDQLVDVVEWNLSGSRITKADLAIIDLLANYKWDRPICFTSSQIQGANRGLSSFLRQDGLASTLTPIKRNGANINTDKMYKLFVTGGIDMDKDGEPNDAFKWGRLDADDVYSDYYTLRMVRSVRIHYFQLAQSLYADMMNAQRDTTEAGQARVTELKEKVGNVLDSHFDKLPIDNVPYMSMTIKLAGLYYAIDDTAKGNKYCGQHAELIAENIRYYSEQNFAYKKEMLPQVGDFLNEMEELGQLNPKFKYKAYDEEGYNKLGQAIQKLVTKDNETFQRIRNSVQAAIQSRRPDQLVLPISFIQDKLPTVLPKQ